MKNLLSIFFVCFLVLTNFYIFHSTNKKVEVYEEKPPFHLIDFTQSYLTSFDSKIEHLQDNDVFTSWKKLRLNPLETDFELELELSHFKKKQIYYAKKFKSLEIYFCEKIQLPLRIEVFLKEAIDMDKELRLPKEKVILTKTIFFADNLKETVYINTNFKNTQKYPQNIYIIGMRGKWLAENFNPTYEPCISEINLN